MIFYHRIARCLLSRHARELPDLRGVTVVLPNYHVAQALAQALSAISGLPALLLPQMMTLSDWTQSVLPDLAVRPDTQRLSALYQALREREWFRDVDLWSLSRELLALMDELTRHRVALPASAHAFATQLAEAYQARCGEALQFEARVVHELWYAMADAGMPDVTAAYQQRLGVLAQHPPRALYLLQTSELAAPEQRFFAACRENAEVTVFDLRAMARDEAQCALLVSALQAEDERADLRTTSASLMPAAKLSGRLQLFAAHGLEQEAEAADVQIRRWLLAGKSSIAVVVQDRLVARRLRALLERAEIQVQDETGWIFSTLSVSTVLMRWLESVQGDFYYQELLDLLKSPYLFAEHSALRRQAAYQFEQLVRKHGVVAHLPDFIALAQREQPELVQPLVRLRQAALSLQLKRATLAGWLVALAESLEILGIHHGWRQDAAGQQLMQLLTLWRQELQADTTPCNFAEWRRWLALQLDANTYRDVSVESPVRFTYLPATRWRRFDAVLLLGCDARHLPAPADAGQWFNDAVRGALGLPLSIAGQHAVRDDLLGLLALNDTVLATWQASQNGEPNLLSPYLEMLRALHLLAFGDDLMAKDLGSMLAVARVTLPDAASGMRGSGGMPRPEPERLPTQISPSAYNALVACPYQYFARHVLKLNELDEVREALDKRDYGTWVHAVLQRFHREVPVLTDPVQDEQSLRRISNEVFAEAVAQDYLGRAWRLCWQERIPAYLDWQRQNEAAGWRYQEAEVTREIEVAENLRLKGRLDRVDYRLDAPQVLRVIDYKTQSIQILRNKIKRPGEDVQLACYAGMAGAEEAVFLSLEDEAEVATVATAEEIGQLADLNLERLRTIFSQLHAGEGLPANGAEAACRYCEMNGLCRRGEWE